MVILIHRIDFEGILFKQSLNTNMVILILLLKDGIIVNKFSLNTNMVILILNKDLSVFNDFVVSLNTNMVILILKMLLMNLYRMNLSQYQYGNSYSMGSFLKKVHYLRVSIPIW